MIEGVEGGDDVGLEHPAGFGGVVVVEAVGVPAVQGFAGDEDLREGGAGVVDDAVDEGAGHGGVVEDLFTVAFTFTFTFTLTHLIPDEGAVVVDGEGVEVEQVVDGADAARGTGGGDDDPDVVAEAAEGFDGLEADALVVIEQRAVEVDGDEADPRCGHAGDAGGGRGWR